MWCGHGSAIERHGTRTRAMQHKQAAERLSAIRLACTTYTHAAANSKEIADIPPFDRRRHCPAILGVFLDSTPQI